MHIYASVNKLFAVAQQWLQTLVYSPCVQALLQACTQGLCSRCAAGSARMVPQACGAPGAHSHGTTCAPPVHQACTAWAGTPCNQGCTGLVQQGLCTRPSEVIFGLLCLMSLLGSGLRTTLRSGMVRRPKPPICLMSLLGLGLFGSYLTPPGIGAKYDPNMTQNDPFCLMSLLGLGPWGPSPGGQI